VTRFQGFLADGRRARRMSVAVALDADALVLDGGDDGPLRWPYAAVTLIADEGRGALTRLAHGEARLVVEDPAFRAALAAAAPRFRPRGRAGTALRVLGLAALSAAVAAALWWGAPLAAGLAAAHFPAALEARLGAAVLAEIPGRRCDDPRGQAALDRLAARLLAGRSPPFAVHVGVLESKKVNAFAAPGGEIRIFDGLLQQAASADEVAGVLAHELSHALQHHPTRHLVRALGTSLLFDLMLGTGGALREAGEVALALSYSRDLEREADDGALALLDAAGISAAPFAGFFERLEAAHAAGSGVPPWLRTHPATAERIAHIRAAAAAGGTPALSPEEWAALKGICGPS
jgi:Zn-dependent protease with chaperone function